MFCPNPGHRNYIRGIKDCGGAVYLAAVLAEPIHVKDTGNVLQAFAYRASWLQTCTQPDRSEASVGNNLPCGNHRREA